MECVNEADRVAREFKEAAKKACTAPFLVTDTFQGTLGEGNQGDSMTSAQFNKIMKLFPQPDLGQKPYRQMKRLPTQSYADDIFHRKSWKGKPS